MPGHVKKSDGPDPGSELEICVLCNVLSSLRSITLAGGEAGAEGEADQEAVRCEEVRLGAGEGDRRLRGGDHRG